MYWITLYCLFCLISSTTCHVPAYAPTPPTLIEQFCVLADACIHDTIPICGKMGDEKRTFLDICDLIEYACDTNQVFSHVDDLPDCPAPPSR